MEGIASSTSADQQRLDFMKLLVTELQHQNPLEPMDNQQMAAQLAQFSQLEETEQMNGNIAEMNETMRKMNSSFQGAMIVAQFDYARSLLGKEVNFYSGDYEQSLAGKVNRVNFVDGEPVLEVDAEVRMPNETIQNKQMTVRLNEISGIGDM